MENQTPAETIRVTTADEFEYRDNTASMYGSCVVTNGGLSGRYTAPADNGRVLRQTLPIPMSSQGEADRFAAGILREANKNAVTGILWTDLLPAFAAGSVAELITTSAASWNGPAFISRIRHDLVANRSKVYFRQPLGGY